MMNPEKHSKTATMNEDDGDLVETLAKCLVELEDNSKIFIESVEQLQYDNCAEELSHEILKLQENIHSILGPLWQQIKDGMFDAKCHLKEKEDELKKLKIDLRNQQNILAKVKNELKNAKTMLFHQSSYAAGLGATLCGLLWKVSRKPFMILDLINDRKIFDFCQMVSYSIKSFFDAYGKHLPDPQSKEVQFISSVIGTIANIAAEPEGRKFLLACEEGEQSIRELVKTVTRMPSAGVYIKKIILMALFNVSLDKRGNSILENDQFFLSMLMKNISDKKSELRCISLKLLQSLAFDIDNLNFLITFINAIQSIKLEEIKEISTEDEQNIILQIIENLEMARVRLQNVEVDLLNGF